MKAYRVVDWEKLFEKSQAKRCKTHHWVAIPNTHGSNGYMAVAEHERAVELFCAFILIVEVASTMPTRGLLVSKGGKPITAANMAFRTHFPVDIFRFAFKELVKPEVGWLEILADSEPTPSGP